MIIWINLSLIYLEDVLIHRKELPEGIRNAVYWNITKFLLFLICSLWKTDTTKMTERTKTYLPVKLLQFLLNSSFVFQGRTETEAKATMVSADCNGHGVPIATSILASFFPVVQLLLLGSAHTAHSYPAICI